MVNEASQPPCGPSHSQRQTGIRPAILSAARVPAPTHSPRASPPDTAVPAQHRKAPACNRQHRYLQPVATQKLDTIPHEDASEGTPNFNTTGTQTIRLLFTSTPNPRRPPLHHGVETKASGESTHPHLYLNAGSLAITGITPDSNVCNRCKSQPKQGWLEAKAEKGFRQHATPASRRTRLAPLCPDGGCHFHGPGI